MKLALTIHDNDYWKTFTSVLKVIEDSWIYNSEVIEERTKQDWIRVLNNLIIGVYELYNNRECNKEYLKLTEKNIFLNEEVDVYLKDNLIICNSDFYMFDSDLLYDGSDSILTY